VRLKCAGRNAECRESTKTAERRAHNYIVMHELQSIMDQDYVLTGCSSLEVDCQGRSGICLSGLFGSQSQSQSLSLSLSTQTSHASLWHSVLRHWQTNNQNSTIGLAPNQPRKTTVTVTATVTTQLYNTMLLVLQ
jgi:hypothetical protein